MMVRAAVTRACNAPLLFWDTLYRYVFELERLESLTYIFKFKLFYKISWMSRVIKVHTPLDQLKMDV